MGLCAWEKEWVQYLEIGRDPPLCYFPLCSLKKYIILCVFICILCVFISILYVFCLAVCMCTTSVPGAQGGAQDVTELLRLELQTVLSNHVCGCRGLNLGELSQLSSHHYSLMAGSICGV